MDIICAPYFTRKTTFSQHDSSTKGISKGANVNDFSLIERWYNSISKLGLYAIIFHNELSSEFIKKYKTDKIKFEQYHILNRPSYNDTRFFMYEDYLHNNKNHIERAFFTDIFDVEFQKNPFELIDKNPTKLLFCCSENITKKNGEWMKKKTIEMKYASARNNYAIGELLYNAGIIGGNIDTLLSLFQYMIYQFSFINREFNANMNVFNVSVETLFPPNKILTGFPLHNIFNSWESLPEVYITHK
jgi:hypothetical protein